MQISYGSLERVSLPSDVRHSLAMFWQSTADARKEMRRLSHSQSQRLRLCGKETRFSRSLTHSLTGLFICLINSLLLRVSAWIRRRARRSRFGQTAATDTEMREEAGKEREKEGAIRVSGLWLRESRVASVAVGNTSNSRRPHQQQEPVSAAAKERKPASLCPPTDRRVQGLVRAKSFCG